MAQLSDNQRQRFSAALERLGGDEETLVMLAAMATEDAPSLLNSLRTAIESKQLSEAARAGHSLKGLLSTFETEMPVSELQPMIDAARDNDVRTTRNILNQLQPSLQHLIDEVGELA